MNRIITIILAAVMLAGCTSEIVRNADGSCVEVVGMSDLRGGMMPQSAKTVECPSYLRLHVDPACDVYVNDKCAIWRK